MSAALRMVHGVTHHEPARARAGYTLFAPMYGRNMWLIDMWGTIAHRWQTENQPGNYGELLSNGNLLFAGRTTPAAIPEFAGNGGQIVELDWNCDTVWEYRDPYLSHCFAPLRNGNLLVAKWRAVPREIAARVRGGQPGTELRGEMYGEAVQEIDRNGAVVWEWLTFEHLDPEQDVIGPFHPRDRWTNLNSLTELPDGRVLVSFRCIDTIAIVDRQTGNIDWRWGPGEIAGQHHPTWLENGNILVFDNGAHRAYTTIDFSRVLEVDPRTGAVEWEYKENPVYDFNSFICSGAQRLDNGNTLICECTKGRLFEVTREGDLVWEFVSPFYYEHPSSRVGVPGVGVRESILLRAFAGLTRLRVQQHGLPLHPLRRRPSGHCWGGPGPRALRGFERPDAPAIRAQPAQQPGAGCQLCAGRAGSRRALARVRFTWNRQRCRGAPFDTPRIKSGATQGEGWVVGGQKSRLIPSSPEGPNRGLIPSRPEGPYRGTPRRRGSTQVGYAPERAYERRLRGDGDRVGSNGLPRASDRQRGEPLYRSGESVDADDERHGETQHETRTILVQPSVEIGQIGILNH